jgi:hypothetical protein
LLTDVRFCELKKFAPAKTRRKIETPGGFLSVLTDGVLPWRQRNQNKKEIIKMKARNRIVGLAITTTVLVIPLRMNAQVNPGPNNSISGTHSSVAGGNWSSISGSNAVIAGGLSNSITASHTAIGGGWGNIASTVFATVAGGFDNRALGQASFIGGGQNNDSLGFETTVAGGVGNTAADLWSAVGGGTSNTASNSFATVGGGASNRAGNSGATVSGGQRNRATASHATVPGGAWADASHHGQFAYASGRFTTNGDAQASMYVLRTSTTNTAAQTEMFLDGSAARMTIASGNTWVFEIQVTARSSANTSAAYLIKGSIDNNSGTTSFLNAPIVEVLGEDDSAWDVTVQADNTNDALVLKVTGTASATIRWVATVRTTEVAH